MNSYDASGRKLAARNFTNVVALPQPLNEGDVLKHVVDEYERVYINTVHNIGNVEYNSLTFYNFSTASTFESFQSSKLYNSEGYARDIFSSVTNPEYYYFCRDHLGNIREVWQGNRRTVVQRTQYYPSGLPWASNSSDNPSLQSRKYNGKKFVEMHGLDEYDYHARGMYPAIMRFTTIDPLAEDYYDVSPYAYVLNNPLRYTDPTGMSSENANDKEDIDGGELTEVTVVASKYDPIGTRAMDAVEGFWEWAEYIAYGRTYQSNVQNTLIKVWRVDHNGIIVGAQPLTGTPPIPSLKNSELFIKGFGYVDKLKFHRIIKPKILKKANELVNYQKIVGKNPDIVIDSGKIILQGAKNSPYAGNTLKVNLNIIDILKKHLY